MSVGRWVDEWSQEIPDGFNFRAKRAKRRPTRSEYGSEEYLVSVTDTSAAARRRVSPYAPL